MTYLRVCGSSTTKSLPHYLYDSDKFVNNVSVIYFLFKCTFMHFFLEGQYFDFTKCGIVTVYSADILTDILTCLTFPHHCRHYQSASQETEKWTIFYLLLTMVIGQYKERSE